MSPAAESVIGPVAETATVPVASGKVQVRAAVKSAEVIVPVKEAVAVVVCGFMAIVSVLAVVEAKVALLVVVRVTPCVPDDCVKPVRPEMAPAEETSQEVVSMARVLELPPIATAPVEPPVAMFTAKLEPAFRLIAAPETEAPRFPVRSWVAVKAPFTVVVCPVLEMETEVALVVPRFRAAAASRVRAPVVVDQVEALPAVKVRAAPEVNDEAPVGVRLTEPAPVAVKFPEVRVKAIAFPEVVIVAPAL